MIGIVFLTFVITIFVIEAIFIANENDYCYANEYKESSYELDNYCTKGYENKDEIKIEHSELYFYDSSDYNPMTTKKFNSLTISPSITDGDDLCFALTYSGNIQKAVFNLSSLGIEGFNATISIEPFLDAPNKVLIILENIKVHKPNENKGNIYIAGGTACSPNKTMVKAVTLGPYELYYTDLRRVFKLFFDNKEFLIAFLTAIIAVGNEVRLRKEKPPIF